MVFDLSSVVATTRNHRWWTGANQPRFMFLALVAALTKVRPPLCIPSNRVFHPLWQGVPDPNLVYPLPLILCLPSPAAGTARFSGLDPTLVTRVTTASKHVQIAIARHGGMMINNGTRVQAARLLLCDYYLIIILDVVVCNYVCECTVGVDVGNGTTILLTSV